MSQNLTMIKMKKEKEKWTHLILILALWNRLSICRLLDSQFATKTVTMYPITTAASWMLTRSISKVLVNTSTKCRLLSKTSNPATSLSILATLFSLTLLRQVSVPSMSSTSVTARRKKLSRPNLCSVLISWRKLSACSVISRLPRIPTIPLATSFLSCLWEIVMSILIPLWLWLFAAAILTKWTRCWCMRWSARAITICCRWCSSASRASLTRNNLTFRKISDIIYIES